MLILRSFRWGFFLELDDFCDDYYFCCPVFCEELLPFGTEGAIWLISFLIEDLDFFAMFRQSSQYQTSILSISS